MSKSNPTLLLDTNIWLDFYLEYRSRHKDAKALLDFAAYKGISVSYVATSAKDTFYIICAELKRLVREEKGGLSLSSASAIRSIAWGCVRNMMENAIAVPIGEPQVWLASHFEDLHNDFEDDLVLAALESSKAEFLVTNDDTLRKKAPKGAYDVCDMLIYLRKQDEIRSLA